MLIIFIYFLMSLCIFHTLTLVWTLSGEKEVSNLEVVILSLLAFFWPIGLIALLVLFIFAGPLLTLLRFIRSRRISIQANH